MALPTYYISTSVTAVDTQTTSKILMLPPANSIRGTNMYIYDATGQASINPVYVSTPSGNSMDNALNTVTLNTDFQSLRLVPFNPTQYAICQSYTGGLSLFTSPPQVGVRFSQLAFIRNWAAFATAGIYMLAVTGPGSSLPGFYTSQDGGNTWTYYARNDEFVDCCISKDGTGNRWYAVSQGIGGSGGAIYSSQDGITWSFAGDSPRGEFAWVAIDCDFDGSVVYAITQYVVYTSGNAGENWLNRAFIIPATTTFTDVAVAGNYAVNYISTANPDGEGIYISTDKLGTTWTLVNTGGTEPVQWLGIATTIDGAIAYATEAGGRIYKTTDGGASWTVVNYVYGYIKPCCNQNGDVLYGLPPDITNPQTIYQTTDGGTTFTAFGEPKVWVGQYGCSYDTGLTFVGGVSGGYIYSGQNAVL